MLAALEARPIPLPQFQGTVKSVIEALQAFAALLSSFLAGALSSLEATVTYFHVVE